MPGKRQNNISAKGFLTASTALLVLALAATAPNATLAQQGGGGAGGGGAGASGSGVDRGSSSPDQTMSGISGASLA